MGDSRESEKKDADGIDPTIAHRLNLPPATSDSPGAESTESGGSSDGPPQADQDPNKLDETLTLRPGNVAGGSGGRSARRTFGDYELLEQIARGGMGVVYRARQTTLNRIVALKMIRSGELAGEEEVKRFHVEAEAAAALDHPAIVPVYDVGEIDGRHYYSMGFVDGQSLSQELQRGPIPPQRAVKLLLAVTEAISYAHEHGVIHRDLKPANILLVDDRRAETDGDSAAASGERSASATPGGSVSASGLLRSALRGGAGEDSQRDLLPKVTDFGLAKQVHEESDLTSTGQILGTPSYMPPEQAQGHANVGPAADVYSLGAVLYACLSGRPPFQAANVLETIQQVVEQDAVSLLRLNRAIDRDLDTICLKCLEKAPEKRYATAADLAADLRRYLRGEPIQARPVNVVERAWRWCRRKPAVAASIFALVGVLVTTGVLAVVAMQLSASRKQADYLEEVAGLRGEKLKAAQELVATQKKIAATERFFSLLSGTQQRTIEAEPGWAFAGLDDLRQAAAIDAPKKNMAVLRTEAARCLAGVDLNRVAEVEMTAGYRPYVIAYSPDGAKVAFGSLRSRRQVRVLICSSPNGDVLHSLSAPNRIPLQLDGVRHISFVADGDSLAVTTRSGQVHRWDLTGEQPSKTTTKIPHGMRQQFVFDPTGKRAIYNADGVLYLWPDLDVAKAEPFGEVGSSALCISPDGRWFASTNGETTHVFDLYSRKLVHAIPTGGRRVCISSDKRRLAIASLEHIAVVDIASGATIRKISDPQIEAVHEKGIRRIEFSPNGRLLLTGGDEQRLKVFDVNSGEVLLRFFAGAVDEVRPVFSPDGRHFACIQNRRGVIYAVSGEASTVACPQDSPISTFQVVRDTNQIVTTSRRRADQRLQVSRWASGESLVERWTTVGEAGEAHLTVSKDGGRMVVAESKSFSGWELLGAEAANEGLQRQKADEALVSYTARVAHANLLLISGDRFYRIFGKTGATAESGPLAALGIPWKRVDAALHWGDGRATLFGGDEFCEFDVVTQRVEEGYPRKIAEHWPGLWPSGIDAAMLFGKNEALFFKGDECIRVTKTDGQTEFAKPAKIEKKFANAFPRDIDAALDDFSGDNSHFFQRDELVVRAGPKKSRKVKIGERFPDAQDLRLDAALDLGLRTGPYRFQRQFSSPKVSRAGPLALSPDGSRLWSIVGTDGVVSWKLPSFKSETRWSNRLLGAAYGIATLLDIEAASENVLVATESGFMYSMNLEEGSPETPFRAPGIPRCLALNDDESLAVCGLADGDTLVFRLDEKKPLATLEGHRDAVRDVAFSPDDELLATASQDQSVRIWVRRGEQFEFVFALDSPGPVGRLQFDRTGRYLYALVDRESALRRWDLEQLRRKLDAIGLAW